MLYPFCAATILASVLDELKLLLLSDKLSVSKRAEVKVAGPNFCTDVIMHSDTQVRSQSQVSDRARE